jgi:hypothetical protein
METHKEAHMGFPPSVSGEQVEAEAVMFSYIPNYLFWYVTKCFLTLFRNPGNHLTGCPPAGVSCAYSVHVRTSEIGGGE